MADSQTFQDVSENQWSNIKAAVASNAGIQIGDDSGQAEQHGVTLGWQYDKDAMTLTVTLMGRAWYDPSEATIDAKLKAWIEGAMGS